MVPLKTSEHSSGIWHGAHSQQASPELMMTHFIIIACMFKQA